MTADIWDTPYSDLDRVMWRVCADRDFRQAPMTLSDANRVANEIAARIFHLYGPTPRHAIVRGLNDKLVDDHGFSHVEAFEAVRQYYETYAPSQRTFLLTITLQDGGDEHELAAWSLSDVERLVNDQMSGELSEGGLICTDADVIEEQETP